MKARLLLLMGQDGVVTDDVARKASSMTKLRRADAVRLLRGLWYHGVHSHKVRTRGENGVFVADSDAPVTPTACIIGANEVATIRKRARACLRFVPLKSPVITGEPPFSRFLDIWQDGTIYDSALYAPLTSFS